MSEGEIILQVAVLLKTGIQYVLALIYTSTP